MNAPVHHHVQHQVENLESTWCFLIIGLTTLSSGLGFQTESPCDAPYSSRAPSPPLPPAHSSKSPACSLFPSSRDSRSSPLTCKESTLAGCCPRPQALPAQAASICPSAEFQRPSMTAEIHNLLMPFCRVCSFILSLGHHWYPGLSQHHQRGCTCLKGPRTKVIRLK